MGLFVLALTIIFIREKPATPPSASAKAETSDKIFQEVKKVLNDRNGVLLTIVFGLLLGIMNTYGTLVGIIANEYGFGTNAASLFGATFIFGGLVGSGVFGGIVETKKNYKSMLSLIGLLSTLLPIIMLFAFISGQVWFVALAAFLVGFALIPILPVGIDFAVELTYPVGEPISSGVVMSAGQFSGIVFTVVGSLLISKMPGNSGSIAAQCVLIFFALVAAIISTRIQENLRRLKHERSQKDLQKGKSEDPSKVQHSD